MFDPTYQLGLDISLLTNKDTVRFFDIDGVLSVYGYGTDGINVCSDDKFDTFIETFNLYKYAVAPEFMREYIERYTVSENNYVVSQSGSPAQDKQKIAFVRRCYPGAFPEDHILFSRTSDKTEAVRGVLKKLQDGEALSHIVIDDSVSVLSTLQDAGIAAVHVSSLMLLASINREEVKEEAKEKGRTIAGKNTGMRIKKIRLSRGLSRSELGELVGLDQNRVQQYENGSRVPKMELLKKFAAVLNVSPLALSEPDTMTDIGIIHALFDTEERSGMSLVESESTGQIFLKVNPGSSLHKMLRGWYGVQEYEDRKRAQAKTEEEREKVERNYQDWKWRFEGKRT